MSKPLKQTCLYSPQAHSRQAPEVSDAVSANEPWPIKLFRCSPLKQDKFHQISNRLPSLDGKTCLDIGSDNGVVSFLLRQQGGEWHSADLIPETVEAIRSLVGERVVQFDGRTLPYPENFFDVIVIVDFLEHIHHDRACVEELRRVAKHDALLIVNVPNPKPGFVRLCKKRCGQTDEAHGHVRPGYTPEELQLLLKGCFELTEIGGYRRFFSEMIDIAVTAGLSLLKKDTKTQKGNVVTEKDSQSLRRTFALYSLLAPVFLLFASLDKWFPWLHAHMLIASAKGSPGGASES